MAVRVRNRVAWRMVAISQAVLPMLHVSLSRVLRFPHCRASTLWCWTATWVRRSGEGIEA